MKIAVDAMGGDHGPEIVVDGAVSAAKEEGMPVILVGNKRSIEAELSKYDTRDLSIDVRNASQTVGMGESPVKAIRRKKNSSIRICFELVKKGEADAVVSAGNSGAAMAAGIFLLKKLKGVDRPAIVVSIPTLKDQAVLLDAGGNVDCKPFHLLQFALMGEVYAHDIMRKERPRIGLLSNGEEEGKGNELTRETHELLKRSKLNYIGYIEGRDVFGGDVDVIVCDGFVGNIVLKLSEGLTEAIITMLKRDIAESFQAKLGYMLSQGVFKKLKKKIDYAEYGGAPMLGIDGVCIVGHGGSSAKAIKNALIRAKECVDRGVNRHMTERLGMNPDLQRIMAENRVKTTAGGED